MRWSTKFMAAVGAVALASMPRAAAANQAYPPALQTDLMLAYTPPCTICHQTGIPSVSNSRSPFSLAMQARGLDLNGNTATIPPAIAKMRTDKVDSDGDGVDDIDELIAGKDPSTGATIGSAGAGGGGMVAVPNELYGCGAQVAPGDAGASFSALAIAVAGLSLAAARRRRR